MHPPRTFKRFWLSMRTGRILQLIKLLHGQKDMIREMQKIDGLSVECKSKTRSRDKRKRRIISKLLKTWLVL